MSTNIIFEACAPQLYDLGYSPIPLSGKTPRIRNWQSLFCDARPKREQLVDEFARANRGRHRMNGVGLATHRGLMFVDIDADNLLHDEVYEMIRAVVPAIERAPKIIGKRGAKYIMRLIETENTSSLNLNGSQTGGRVEFLVHRRIGAIPPTIHPSTGQPFTFDPDSCRQVLADTHLDDLVAISLPEIEVLRSLFEIKREAPHHSETTRNRITEQREAESAQESWNGNCLEMRRVAKALTYLDPNAEDIWWRVGAALRNWTGGHPQARQLFDTWSGGGSINGYEFTGAPDKFNKTKTQDEAWFQERPDIGVGTIIHLAQKKGFDATLRQWKTLKYSRSQADTKSLVKDTPFGRAAEQLPRDRVDFHNSLEAILSWALNDRSISKSDIRLLNQLLQFMNLKHGYAWPSYERLSENTGISQEQLYKHVTKLERAGYILRARNNYNPDSSKRTAFAILPPPDLTWQQLLGRHRQQLGHPPAASAGDEHVFGATVEQGNSALTEVTKACEKEGATQPGPKTRKSNEAGQTDPDITNRERSSGVGGEEWRRTDPAASSINSISHLVSVGIVENENLVQLLQVCSSDNFGAGTVQSVLLMINRATLGIDPPHQPNTKIAVSDQQVRHAIDKAFISTFDPPRMHDKRSQRIDLDLTGGKASRDCLKMFRGKLEIELGKSGYETASYLQRKASWRPSQST